MPSDEQKKALARAMVTLGARAVIVSAALDIPMGLARAIYREVAHRPSPSGQMPYSHDVYFQPVMRVHASMFLLLYRIALASCHERALAYISAYTKYLACAGSSPELSVDRAWVLVVLASSHNPYVGFATCRKCSGSYIVQPHEVKSRFTCPVCEGRTEKAATLRRGFAASRSASAGVEVAAA